MPALLVEFVSLAPENGSHESAIQKLSDSAFKLFNPLNDHTESLWHLNVNSLLLNLLLGVGGHILSELSADLVLENLSLFAALKREQLANELSEARGVLYSFFNKPIEELLDAASVGHAIVLELEHRAGLVHYIEF